MSKTARQKPRSNLYDGRIYSTLVDPQMRRLHGLIEKQIPKGTRILDACCGTGALALRLASRNREVVGVDLSPKMIQYAKHECRKLECKNVRFSVGDVSHLDEFEDRAFDFATLVMAIHEMPREVRLPAILELLRIAQKVVVVDFGAPMPWNTAGIRNRFMEFSAGRRHFSNFRDYSSRSGLPPLLRDAGATILAERTIDSGTKLLAVLRC